MKTGNIYLKEGTSDWSKVKTAKNSLTLTNNNLDFDLNEVVSNLIIDNNKHLQGLLDLYNQDKKDHVKACYYCFHVNQRQWMALDHEWDFDSEMKRIAANAKEYRTERNVYENITINGQVIRKLTMKNISADNLGFDETTLQFSKFFGATGILAYIRIQ